jgi:hypothetical protein
MQAKRRVPTWAVVLMSVAGTLVAQPLVGRAVLAQSPPGPNRLDKRFQDSVEAHFRSLGLDGLVSSSAGHVSDRRFSMISMDGAYAVPMAPESKEDKFERAPGDGAKRLFEAVAATDRFFRQEGFLPCPGGFVVVPGYARVYYNEGGGESMFGKGSGIAPPEHRNLVVSGPGYGGTAAFGNALAVVLLRYRLRQTDEAECAVVFILDQVQGTMGAAFSLDGQMNAQWGKVDFQTSSFAFELLGGPTQSPIVEHSSTEAAADPSGQ